MFFFIIVIIFFLSNRGETDLGVFFVVLDYLWKQNAYNFVQACLKHDNDTTQF